MVILGFDYFKSDQAPADPAEKFLVRLTNWLSNTEATCFLVLLSPQEINIHQPLPGPFDASRTSQTPLIKSSQFAPDDFKATENPDKLLFYD